jgi:multiple sugar transport system substrate-binding protein
MKHNTWRFILIITMVLSLVLSACTSGEPPQVEPAAQEQSGQPSEGESPAETEAAAVAPGGGQAAGTGAGSAESPYEKHRGETIVVSWPSLSHFQVAAELIPQFEEETGINVETEFIDYVSLHDKQVLEMSKPEGDYDVVAWTIFWKNEYVNKGLLAPLSQYFGNPTLVLPDYDVEDIVPGYLVSGSAIGGRKGYLEGPMQGIYGVPFGAETSLLAYRKDIFEENNLKVPETYDELLETAQWITDNVDGMYGITSRGAAGHQIVAGWLLHLTPYGGSVFDDQWNPIVNNEAGVKSLEALGVIMKNSPPGVTTYGFGEAANAFLQGEAAMYLDAHKIAAMSRDPNQSKVIDKVGFALHPTDVTCGAETGGQAMGIAANSQHKEAAFLFIQWMTSKAIDKKLAEIGGDVIRFSTLADPDLQAKFPEYPVLLEQLKCAATDWRPLIPEWGAINAPILGVKISEFSTGDKSAQQALDEAAELIREEMARSGYYSWDD